jgi:hypothetical protein
MSLRWLLSSKVYPSQVGTCLRPPAKKISPINVLPDRESVNQPGDWQKAQSYIRQIIADPPTPHVIKRLLTQITPLPRSLYTLVGQFEGAIHPSVPDVNIIWGLTELNIKVRRCPINLGSEIADIGESCHVNPQRSSLRLWAG